MTDRFYVEEDCVIDRETDSIVDGVLIAGLGIHTQSAEEQCERLNRLHRRLQ